MVKRNLARTVSQRFVCAAAVGLLALVAGCGSSADPTPGLVISGAGLRTSKPPWPPEYAHLAQRLHEIGIPPGGQEKFHIHAMLHIYINGLLSPLPADIGIDQAERLESSLHTHDGTGIIHMEAPRPYKFTLGDFFSVWGVKLGPAQLGGLRGYGGDHLHFYVNGKPLGNPAAYVLHNGDSVVIGYGAESSFPHTPSTFLLKEVEKGEGGLGCSSARAGHHTKSCLVVKAQASPGSSKR